MRKLLTGLSAAVLTVLILLVSAQGEENGITKYMSLHKTQYSVADLTPTVCALWNIKEPECCVRPPIQAVLDLARTKLPQDQKIEKTLIFCADAVGDFLVSKYAADFKPLQDQSDFIMTGSNVIPSVTPVCFATIFTGAPPEVHGITKYMRPVLKVETLFDVFAKNGKNTAIISVNHCSIDLIFRERNIDYFSLRSDEASYQLARRILAEGGWNYDLILCYDGGYDSAMHHNGVFAEKSVQAMRDSIRRCLDLIQQADRCWPDKNRLSIFVSDHGAHDAIPGKGIHGTKKPDDMIVDHYYRIRAAQPAK